MSQCSPPTIDRDPTHQKLPIPHILPFIFSSTTNTIMTRSLFHAFCLALSISTVFALDADRVGEFANRNRGVRRLSHKGMGMMMSKKSSAPSVTPTVSPQPTRSPAPSAVPTKSRAPSEAPSPFPTDTPSARPSVQPTTSPEPSAEPTTSPMPTASLAPSSSPTFCIKGKGMMGGSSKSGKGMMMGSRHLSKGKGSSKNLECFDTAFPTYAPTFKETASDTAADSEVDDYYYYDSGKMGMMMGKGKGYGMMGMMM